MRNWNIGDITSGQVAKLRFEPTYEELKLLSIIAERSGHSRFEPTYEELKRAMDEGKIKRGLEFWAYLWGIETNLFNLSP